MPPTSPMTELLNDLTARRDARAQHEADLQKWLADLEELEKRIEGWLQPLCDESVLTVEQKHIEIHETDHGTYKAPTISMSFPGTGRWVSFEPRGLAVVGAVLGQGMSVQGMRGRADLASASGERLMVFRDAESNWFFAGQLPGHNGVQHPLNEDTFAVALKWLLP